MNIGDKVRMLRAKEQGVVTRLLPDNLIEVEIEDGFRIPIMRSELVLVSPLEAERLLKQAPGIEPQKPLAPAVISNQGIYMAFVPQNDREVALYLVNNTDWDVPYTILEERGMLTRGLQSGLLKGKSQTKLNEYYALVKFEDWPTFVVQMLWFRAGNVALRPPLVKRLKARAETFYKSKANVPVVNQPGHLFQLDADEKMAPEPGAAGKSQPAPTLKADAIKAEMLAPKSDPIGVTITRPTAVVDLHVEALLPNGPEKRSPADLLELQLKTFEKSLENAIATGMNEITFIHGAGTGALRNELHRRLGKHPHVKFLRTPRNRNSAMARPKFRSSNGQRGYLLLGIWLSSCQPSTQNLNPKAPDAAYSRTAMDVRNEKFLSTVNVPVAISLADVERQINAQVSGLIYEGGSADDPTADSRYPYQAKVWKRSAINVRAGLADADTDAAKDSVFAFDVPMRIWTKAGVSVLGITQFKETEFEIDLHFTTRFSIDPDWSVSTQTKATGYEWVKKPVFRIVGFDIPIAGFVGKIIDKNLGTITQALDQQVRKNIDLKTPVLQAWNSIRQPYLLSEPYHTYLLVVPKRIVCTPLQFGADVIRTTIGIEGYTLTTVGPKPDVRPAVTLPDLVTVKQVPTAFRVGVMAEASYTEVAKVASQEMVGKTFGFSNNRYSVTITDMDVYGQNDNLIIRAGLKGSVDGHIFLRGKPFYNPETKTISLHDLKYDLDTRSLLQRTASWLLQGTLARTMEKNLTFPVGAQLDELHRTLQSQLTNNHIAKGVVLNGRLDSLQPDQVYLTATSLLAVVYASGHVGVRVEGLQ